jgi:hypothetical protein
MMLVGMGRRPRMGSHFDWVREAPVPLWCHLRRPGLCLPACPAACPIAQLLQLGTAQLRSRLMPKAKFSLTIAHRTYQPKVMQRTDCGLMRVLSAS